MENIVATRSMEPSRLPERVFLRFASMRVQAAVPGGQRASDRRMDTWRGERAGSSALGPRQRDRALEADADARSSEARERSRSVSPSRYRSEPERTAVRESSAKPAVRALCSAAGHPCSLNSDQCAQWQIRPRPNALDGWAGPAPGSLASACSASECRRIPSACARSSVPRGGWVLKSSVPVLP